MIQVGPILLGPIAMSGCRSSARQRSNHSETRRSGGCGIGARELSISTRRPTRSRRAARRAETQTLLFSACRPRPLLTTTETALRPPPPSARASRSSPVWASPPGDPCTAATPCLWRDTTPPSDLHTEPVNPAPGSRRTCSRIPGPRPAPSSSSSSRRRRRRRSRLFFPAATAVFPSRRRAFHKTSTILPILSHRSPPHLFRRLYRRRQPPPPPLCCFPENLKGGIVSEAALIITTNRQASWNAAGEEEEQEGTETTGSCNSSSSISSSSSSSSNTVIQESNRGTPPLKESVQTHRKGAL